MATAPSRRPLLRRPAVLVALALLAALAAVALWLFQPWKLVVDETVAEAPPAVGAPAVGAAAPEVVARGELISHEHATSGSVQVLRLADGSRVLRLEDLATSNGPALRVRLSDQPVVDGEDGWHVFDDGRSVDLGDLKGNLGSSNYPIPAGADLTGLTSVSIWCDRFAVSFGAATLTPGA